MVGRKTSLIGLSVAAIVMLSGSVIAGTIGFAQAALITEEEHWKYNVDRWQWDEERRRTYGLIIPQIVIQNETADRLEGFIADANGTRLDFYDGNQVVHVRYMSNSSVSGWIMVGWLNEGYFAIDIPQAYREAEIVKIYIGNNHYTVDNGTPTTPQTRVITNSVIATFRTNSTLDHIVETEVAQVEKPKPVRSVHDGGSLIDWILSQNGLLSVRSSDSGK